MKWIYTILAATLSLSVAFSQDKVQQEIDSAATVILNYKHIVSWQMTRTDSTIRLSRVGNLKVIPANSKPSTYTLKNLKSDSVIVLLTFIPSPRNVKNKEIAFNDSLRNRIDSIKKYPALFIPQYDQEASPLQEFDVKRLCAMLERQFLATPNITHNEVGISLSLSYDYDTMKLIPEEMDEEVKQLLVHISAKAFQSTTFLTGQKRTE